MKLTNTDIEIISSEIETIFIKKNKIILSNYLESEQYKNDFEAFKEEYKNVLDMIDSKQIVSFIVYNEILAHQSTIRNEKDIENYIISIFKKRNGNFFIYKNLINSVIKRENLISKIDGFTNYDEFIKNILSKLENEEVI